MDLNKIELIRDSIKQQLGNFVSGDNVKIPITFILDNNSLTDAINVFEVSSKQEAEDITFEITGERNIVYKVRNYDEKLFLTVIAYLPSPLF